MLSLTIAVKLATGLLLKAALGKSERQLWARSGLSYPSNLRSFRVRGAKYANADWHDNRAIDAAEGTCLSEIADFSIWAKVRPTHKREFRKWMAGQTGWREIDVFRLLGPSVDEGSPVELFMRLGWEDAQLELKQLPPFVEIGSAQLTVSSSTPNGPYCAIHSLHVWRIGCPVCQNNFIHRGRHRDAWNYGNAPV